MYFTWKKNVFKRLQKKNIVPLTPLLDFYRRLQLLITLKHNSEVSGLIFYSFFMLCDCHRRKTTTVNAYYTQVHSACCNVFKVQIELGSGNDEYCLLSHQSTHSDIYQKFLFYIFKMTNDSYRTTRNCMLRYINICLISNKHF